MQARRIEAEARRSVDESLQQAEEIRNTKRRGNYYRKRRYQRIVERYEKKAEESLIKVEKAKKQAEKLKRQLDN